VPAGTPANTQLAAPPRIGAITPRHSWPIFGNAAGELKSAQRTSPSLLRAPVTVIDSFPAGCERPAVSVDARTSAVTAATFARNECKAKSPSQKHYRRCQRVTSRDRRRHSQRAYNLSNRHVGMAHNRDLRRRAFGAEIA
jgi:hypothetical protein